MSEGIWERGQEGGVGEGELPTRTAKKKKKALEEKGRL